MVDDVAELFLRVGTGDVSAVARMLRFRPELARAEDAAGLNVMQFARYMREQAILSLLIDAGPPLDVFDAAALDRCDDLRALLELDPMAAQRRRPDGRTALHAAAANGCPDAARLLLDACAAVDVLTSDGTAITPLHAAVTNGSVEACRVLLRSGADPNARQRGGVTPLMLAAAANHREIVEMLIARNANVEWRDSAGQTAAGHAARAGHLELAARLRLGERVVDRQKA
jgi:ankyrin repeat protein